MRFQKHRHNGAPAQSTASCFLHVASYRRHISRFRIVLTHLSPQITRHQGRILSETHRGSPQEYYDADNTALSPVSIEKDGVAIKLHTHI